MAAGGGDGGGGIAGQHRLRHGDVLANGCLDDAGQGAGDPAHVERDVIQALRQ